MTKIIAGKVAVVSGSGSGIGRAIALLYADEGASVVVSDINEAAAKETVALIEEKGGTAVYYIANTSSAEENEGLVNFTVETYGALHIACNNAGIGGAEGDIGAYAPAEWDRVISVNLSGVFYAMRFQLPAIMASGGGSIVNMASIMGQVAFARHGAYTAAKHGVIGLTRAAALEYAQRNVRINAVGPGFIDSPFLHSLPEDDYKALANLHPVGRMGTPNEVAELVLWLSSNKASFVTGSYYPVDGGYLAR